MHFHRVTQQIFWNKQCQIFFVKSDLFLYIGPMLWKKCCSESLQNVTVRRNAYTYHFIVVTVQIFDSDALRISIFWVIHHPLVFGDYFKIPQPWFAWFQQCVAAFAVVFELHAVKPLVMWIAGGVAFTCKYKMKYKWMGKCMLWKMSLKCYNVSNVCFLDLHNLFDLFSKH